MKMLAVTLKGVSIFLLVSFAIFCIAQEPASPVVNAPTALTSNSAQQQKVFVFVQRTDRHAKYSSSEVFHNVLDDVLEYLKAKNVAIAVDEFGGRNHAEGATPLDTVFTIARDAQANSVMYVVVDRPITKWLKISVQCFDMNQKLLWQDEVASGGGLSGGHGFEVSTKKLHAQLDKRVGQTGLPVLVSAKEPVAEK